MKPQLPAPTEGAADVAKLATGVGSAIASIWFPGAAFAGPVLNFAIDKFVERPKRMLMEALKEGDVTLLTDEKRAEFIPMAYRFMEAAIAVVAEQGGSYVYPRSERPVPLDWDMDPARGACFYVWEGEPDCLIGRTLVRLGLPLDLLEEQENEPADVVWSYAENLQSALDGAKKAQAERDERSANFMAELVADDKRHGVP